MLRNGDLTLEHADRQADIGGREIDLSAREFALAEAFLRHPGQVLSREQLLSHIWGYDYDPSNIVEVYIRYLRNKIGPQTRIVTLRGAGYLAYPRERGRSVRPARAPRLRLGPRRACRRTGSRRWTRDRAQRREACT